MKCLFVIIVTMYGFMPLAYAKNACPPTSQMPGNQLLVGWITNGRTTSQFASGSEDAGATSVGEFRVLAVINNGKIMETNGSSIKNGQQFWPVANPDIAVHLASVNSFLDRMADDHCVYYASIKNHKFPIWSLFISRPDHRFRTPSEADSKLFYSLNSSCVNQGDYPEGKKPPCVRPRLLAVTDINKNNRPEFWATQPYMWDDGLSIWEYDGKNLVRIFEVCVGCSD